VFNAIILFSVTHCRLAIFALCGVAMAAKAVDFQEKQKEALSQVLLVLHL